MLFSELYSSYYNAVAEILKSALNGNYDKKKIREIINENAFGESFITIQNALNDGTWPLIGEDGVPIIKSEPEMPLTILQKRWLKSIAQDPRIRLFDVTLPDFPDVKPLFDDSICLVYDRYNDGDNYEDENYIKNFRTILNASKKHVPLEFVYLSSRKIKKKFVAIPELIEYSEKDDKFRVQTTGNSFYGTVNVDRVVSCKIFEGNFVPETTCASGRAEELVLEVTDERNALQRVLLHFAHFKKEAEKTADNKYRIKIEYNSDDRKEMLIRILSFGPFVKVIEPDDFVREIKEKLLKQKNIQNS